MSAISDALRRASTAAKSTPPPATAESTPAETNDSSATPPPLPPMPVAAEVPPMIAAANEFPMEPGSIVPRPRSRVLPIVFAVLVFLCVLGAAASFLYARQHGPLLAKYAQMLKEDVAPEEEEEVPENEIRPATQSQAPAGNSAPVAASVAPVAATRPAAPAARPAPAATPAPVVPTPAPVATTPVRFPALKLQSIFYRPSNPSVMINGKTLFISDEISGVTVADIKPSSVTLVLSGQTNVLTLR